MDPIIEKVIAILEGSKRKRDEIFNQMEKSVENAIDKAFEQVIGENIPKTIEEYAKDEDVDIEFKLSYEHEEEKDKKDNQTRF